MIQIIKTVEGEELEDKFDSRQPSAGDSKLKAER